MEWDRERFTAEMNAALVIDGLVFVCWIVSIGPGDSFMKTGILVATLAGTFVGCSIGHPRRATLLALAAALFSAWLRGYIVFRIYQSTPPYWQNGHYLFWF